MAVVGSAEIVVRAITNKVKDDIDKAFRDVRPTIQAHGRQAGKDFAGAFGQSMRQSMSRELRDAIQDSTSSIDDIMRRGLGGAAEGAAEEAGEQMSRSLTRAGGSAGGSAAKSFGQVFAADFRGAFDRFVNLASITTLLGPLIANLVGALSAAVSGLFAMASAAAQAAGGLAVLPGIISVVAQSMFSIKLAFGGVGEAIKLGSQAQKAAASGAGAAARAAGSGVEAAKKLQKATDDLKYAQEQAKKAQDALNEAQKAASEGAEEQALAEKLLTIAQQKKNETLSDPNATAAQGAAAQQGVDSAKYALDQVVDARQKANQKLQKAAEDNDTAQAKLAAAQAARDRAAKASQSGGVSSPAVKAANAYADALANLTPQAQAFVKKVLEMKEAFKEVGDAVAAQFFPPLTQALTLIQKSDFFGILKTELSKTGGILGNIGLQFAKAFTSDKPIRGTVTNLQRFQNILRGNNGILKIFTTKMKDLGGETDDTATPIDHFVSLLLKILRAIQPITTRFVTWIATMIAAADAAATLGSEAKVLTDGKVEPGKGLLGFFQRAGDRAAQLGRIFGNIGGAIRGLSDAAAPAGDSLIDSFEKATQTLETNIKDSKTELTKFFDGVKENLKDIGDLVVVISDEFLELGDNEGIGKFAEGLEPAARNLGDIADKMTTAEVSASFSDFITKLTELGDELTQSSQLDTFLDTLGQVASALTLLAKGFNAIPFSGFLLSVLAVNAALKTTATVLGFGPSFKRFQGALGNIAKKIPGVKQLGEAFKKLGAKIKELPGIKQLRNLAAPEATAPDTDEAEDDAEDRGQTVGEKFAAGVAKGLADGESDIIKAIDDLIDKISDEVKAFADLSDELGKDVVEGFAKGIRESSPLLVTAADEMGDELIQALKTRLGIASPAKKMVPLGEDTGEGYVKGLRSEIDNAFRAGQDVADAAADGARAGGKGTVATGKVDGKIASASAGAADAGSVAVIGTTGKVLDDVDKKTEKTNKRFGKLRGGIGKMGGAFKGLGAGMLGLMGGPMGILLAALPLLILAFQKLYEKSPQFRKFIDGIVKAVKPFAEAVGKFIVEKLNDFFKLVNDNMPQIKKVFSQVLGAVGKVFKAVFPVAAKIVKVLFTVIKFYITKIFIPVWARIFKVVKALIPVFVSIFNRAKSIVKGAFNGIKTVWNSVLKPVFNGIKTVGEKVFNAVKTVINGMKTAFSKAVDGIKKMKEGLTTAFNAVKDAAKVPIKFVVNTLWNNGLRAMITKIPGVPNGFGKVDVSGWAQGGWTGPGGKYQPAGIVHRDEFVIQKSSRRIFERLYPGLLDIINRTGKMPTGHAAGGLVRGNYSGAISPRLRGMRGYLDGGDIIGGLKNVGGGLIGGVKWLGDKTIDGVKWTYKKAKAMADAIKDALSFLAGLPGQITSGLVGSAWGQKITNVPKGVANDAVRYLNKFIPNGIPGIKNNPFGLPFGANLGFMAKGGRVRKGMPYIVGEMRPELFIPDSAGTIIPDLSRLGSQSTVQSILSNLRAIEGGATVTTNDNSGNRVMNINVHNPKQERSSQSVTRAIRGKAISSGWGI